jgi:hypothetical protein
MVGVYARQGVPDSFLLFPDSVQATNPLLLFASDGCLLMNDFGRGKEKDHKKG